jgi:flagellar basal body P-ring formation protein FlgA
MHGKVKREWHLAVGAAGFAALLLAQPGNSQTGALHDVAALAAQVRGFAQGSPRLDPRLVVPRCLAPALSWAREDVVRVDCAGPAWTLYIPIDQAAGLVGSAPAARARPAVKRGERVVVEAAGAGFAVSIEAEAERDADGDRVALKGPGGRRFTARIEQGGRLVLAR